MMYIDGTAYPMDTKIYWDASGGEMVDIRTTTIQELLDKGYDTWRQKMKKISMNPTQEDYVKEWMSMHYATFVRP